jgi:uncharacterized membrane protein
VERRQRPRNREVYIDAFRGLMALVMVQGHVFDDLVQPALRAATGYQVEAMFHGSTAPGFLFASGFVAGLPRSPLSVKATLRRARRLLFVLGIGYSLHLPFFSLAKTLAEATLRDRREMLACHALQLIAVTQLSVLLLQWLAGRRWVAASAAAAVAIVAATPAVWASGLSARVPLALGAYLDQAAAPSQYPVFPFAAFVFAGTAAGAALGRQEPHRRHRRELVAGLVLVLAGIALALLFARRYDFWTVSPGYTILRLGGLLLLLLGVERAARAEVPGVRPLALLGHETLLVYVLHLLILFGGVVLPSPLLAWSNRLDFGGAAAVLLLMLPVLYVAAWGWHRVKMRAPHHASLVLAFLTIWFLWELATRPW